MKFIKRLSSQFTAKKLGYRWRQLQNALRDTKSLWSEGLADEIAHWEDVFSDPEKYKTVITRADKSRPLHDAITDKVELPDNIEVKILDIGAGPITRLGYVWGNRRIEITPIDPLAEEYNRLLKQVNCEPPFRTQLALAEEIGQRFAPESFDIVYSNNALDHSYDPMSAIRQALLLLKPNGTIVLNHKRNEGKRVYHGLHQWNFDVQANEFIIWNMKQRYNVRQELGNVRIAASILGSVETSNWQNVRVYIRKQN